MASHSEQNTESVFLRTKWQEEHALRKQEEALKENLLRFANAVKRITKERTHDTHLALYQIEQELKHYHLD